MNEKALMIATFLLIVVTAGATVGQVVVSSANYRVASVTLARVSELERRVVEVEANLRKVLHTPLPPQQQKPKNQE